MVKPPLAYFDRTTGVCSRYERLEAPDEVRKTHTATAEAEYLPLILTPDFCESFRLDRTPGLEVNEGYLPRTHRKPILSQDNSPKQFA